jgi:hypothetical protein
MEGFAYAEPPVPADWQGHETLYTDVVVPACRGCHILRGSRAQPDIDFTSFGKFQGYAIFPGNTYPKNADFDDRLKVHVIDRGDMQLAKIIFDAFQSSDGKTTLADFLEQQGFAVRRRRRGAAAGPADRRPGPTVSSPAGRRSSRRRRACFPALSRGRCNSAQWACTESHQRQYRVARVRRIGRRHVHAPADHEQWQRAAHRRRSRWSFKVRRPPHG